MLLDVLGQAGQGLVAEDRSGICKRGQSATGVHTPFLSQLDNHWTVLVGNYGHWLHLLLHAFFQHLTKFDDLCELLSDGQSADWNGPERTGESL